MTNIASNWRALSGKNNWEGLLDPIDNDLRSYVIHYGKMVGAVVDALNDLKVSEAYGLSLYPPEELFTQVGLRKGNPFEYRVTKYFYLQSEFSFLGVTLHEGSAWIGYVAVSTDASRSILGRRDILVCWRGPNTATEWLKDFPISKTSAADILGATNNPMVHLGLHDSYTAKDENSIYNKISARDQVLGEIKRLVGEYAKEREVSITVAGHSLGAALATLNAMDIVANGLNKPTESVPGFPVTAFAYGSPRVGNKGFQKVFNGLCNLSNFSNLRLLRIKNSNDPVPRFPVGYSDVGIELEIDSMQSPYLKNLSISEAHDLNVYLHGIAGYQGRMQKFELVTDLVPRHDIALVNKHTRGLLSNQEVHVPPNWWAVRNNTMVQMEDGSWKLKDYYVPEPPKISRPNSGILRERKGKRKKPS